MTATAPELSALPVARTDRWQPLRLGLVDLFYYDYQEFWFRDGRLMLRGNNGTGKSKVLALSLPFLLDGELAAHRVEPDGDPKKRMEWNLLLDGRHEERLGYTWLEFGRRTATGEHAYVTIGCGLRAVAGRGIADKWFFLTSQRLGTDLFLISPGGTALTRERLEAEVGLSGQVVRTAEAYRRLVDEHLFRLGPDRYDALVDLLVQLRAPQLSKKPDEARLSGALSQALAPVDQAVLADVAAAFHDLEQQRTELEGLRETRGHVERFLTRYTAYARIAARRAETALRTAQSAYEKAGRSLVALREQLAAARIARYEAAAALEAAERALIELAAVREELRERPELKDLDHAEGALQTAAKWAATARDRADRAVSDAGSRRARLADAEAAAGRALGALLDGAATARTSAGAAGLAAGHDRAADPLSLPDGVADDRAVAAATTAWRTLAEARELAANQVLTLAQVAAKAEDSAAEARRHLGDREASRDAALDEVADAQAGVEEAAEDLVAAWRAYAGQAVELAAPDPEEVGLASWARTLAGPNPASVAARAAAQSAHAALAGRRAAAEAAEASAVGALRLLEQEDAGLRSGVVRHPPAPHTRDAESRAARPGAPFWQVVDFADGIDEAQRVGLEAALEAAGILDAWVTPDGALLDAGISDVVVTGGQMGSPNLGSVLVPAPDAGAVPTEAVAAVLAGIGFGPDSGPSWVSADGRFRVGALAGSGAKDAAEYVGHAAREAALRRRLAELVEEIAAARADVVRAAKAVAEVTQRQERLSAEIAREPADAALRDAHGEVGARRRHAEQCAEAVVRARAVVAEREVAAAEAVRVRDEAAADRGLSTSEADLRETLAAVGRYRTAAVELTAAVREHAGRLRELATSSAEAVAAQATLATTAAERNAAEGEHDVAAARLRTLQESIGATVAELQQRLAETTAALARTRADRQEAAADLQDHVAAAAVLEGREVELTERQQELVTERDAAVFAFHRFASTGLLVVAVPELEVLEIGTGWEASPAVQLARRAEEALAEVDAGEHAWRRVNDDIVRRFTELGEGLSRHGHQAQSELKEDRFVVTITFQSRPRTPGELTALLDGEVDYRERMLSARERELLSEHLVNDVAGHLQELITEAESQVSAMNAELDERPTSTGMKLRLRWEPRPDGPDGLPQARARLLRQSADLWSPDDRAAVSEFLAAQIERERTAGAEGTWHEHLARALDYRAWHRFVIERRQDGKWRSATGPASGGERVLTVSLPLFAAASAHYRSADPYAPRLVLLDEAFAGVDDDSRAKCLGLLAHFDLDVVMTSEREWGFYATVPGIATHQLVRREGIDAVHVSTWEWDGHTPTQVQRTFVDRARDEGVAVATEEGLF
ncbi:MAG: TIGR02680 family protein [Sporichthyaceae bacterium]